MENNKICPYCGQDQIPFKLGVCVCGCQVGKTQYVKDSQEFAANYYTFLGIKNNPLAAGYVPSEWERLNIKIEFEPLNIEGFNDSIEAVIKLNKEFPI